MSAAGTGLRSASEVGHAAACAACTPMIRTSGLRTRSDAAIPASSPPPPSGTITVPTSGSCSTISSPTVACPSTMSRWSNGWMRVAPFSAAKAWARVRHSSIVAPPSTTSAPYARVACTFGSDAPAGMNTVEAMPSVVADQATPCAWLPADAATTPPARSASFSRAMRAYAPRGLNEPVRCRFSHLSHTS